MKNSFVLFKEYKNFLGILSQEQKGNLLDAIFNYECDEELPEMDDSVKVVFHYIKSKLDETDKRYEEVCEKRSDAAKKSKENKSKQKSANVTNANKCSKSKQTEQNAPDSDNDNDSDNDIDNVIDNDLKETPTESVSKKKTSKKESPVYFPQDELLEKTFQDYILTRKQIKAPMTDRAIELAINKLNDLSNGDNNRAVKILERSIMNGWKGLFPLDDPPNKSSGFKKAEDELHDFYAMTKDWAERSAYESTGI